MKQGKGILLIALCFGAVLAVAAPAEAQEECVTTCDEYDQGQCVMERHTCTYEPSKPNFGAIAYGPTSKAWGYSYGWDSEAQAENAAVANCAQHGNDCEVAVWYQRQCAAVVSDAGATYYWGLGDGTPAAVAKAQKTCAQDGGKICHPEVAECSR